MILYPLKLAAASLRRNPGMTLLSIGAIALGVTVAGAFVTFHHVYSADPIPGKSDKLFYVRLDSWGADAPADLNHPERPPIQLTWRDATTLLEKGAAEGVVRHQAAMFHGSLSVYPDAESRVPEGTSTRFTSRGFFDLFDVPFLYGGTWSADDDREGRRVAVLGRAMSERLFGRADSVGESVRTRDGLYRVVGVIDTWRPAVKFYDVLSDGARARTDDIFAPLRRMENGGVPLSGNFGSWRSREPGIEGFLASETVWTQMWVELDGAAERQAYQAFLDAYTEGERRFGRFQRPTNNWVQPLDEWLAERQVVPPYASSLLLIGLLFLGVCAVNLIGLLLGKFLSRTAEVGIRRALGASRRTIFLQYLLECELTSLLGGAIGWGLLAVLVTLANRLPGAELALDLDLAVAAGVLLLTLAAGFVAGAYPAWHLSAQPPAQHLRLGA